MFYIVNLSAQIGGNCLIFDGTDDYIDCGNTINSSIGSQITLSAWVYPELNDYGDRGIVGNFWYDGGAKGGASIFAWQSGAFPSTDHIWYAMVSNQSGGTLTVSSPFLIELNKWTHVSMTYDNSTLRLFIDGVEVAAASGSGYLEDPTTNNSFYVAKHSYASNYFNGKMDEVRVWNSTRSTDEIRANMYEQLVGNETGLVAYYNFNESSGTSLDDGSTNSNSGTLTNMAGTEWKPSSAFFGPKNCLDFDGVNDYVDCGTNASLSSLSNISVEAWVYPTSSSSWQEVFHKQDNVGNPNSVTLALSGGTDIYTFVNSGSTGATSNSITDVLTLNEWNHIAMTWQNSDGEVNVYVNGVNVSTYNGSTDALPVVGTGKAFLGSLSGSTEFFTGKIDEVRIWTDVRTETEIRNNMLKTLNGNETGLAAYYNFDNTSGTVLPDYSGNNSDGTLTNMDNADWMASSSFNTWLNTSSSDWTVATNWSRGSVPSSGENVGLFNYSSYTNATISGSPVLNNLIVASSAVPTLSSGFTVNRNMILLDDVDLNGQTVTLGSLAKLVEQSAYFSGTTGQIQTTRNLNNISEDVAGLGVNITTSADLGSTTIIRRHNASGERAILRNYQINPTNNSGLNATLVYNYLDAELNGRTEASLKLFRSTDGSTDWTEKTSSINTTDNTLTLSSIDAFSYWTAADETANVTLTYTPPVLTTTAISSITTGSADSGGDISYDGGYSVTARGVCWNASGTPTTSDSYTTDGTGTGSYASSLSSLSSGITYYVRAYATNSEGTAYGNELSFTTTGTLPTVTTQSVSNIGATTATGNGNITDLGGPNPTSHGVCWNTSGTPTIADSKTDEGSTSSTGAFTSSITGLTMGITYYVRAYATNTEGTAYGTEVNFVPGCILIGATYYATLKDAFDAINAGTHTGAITAYVKGNSTETSSAVLNADGSGSTSYTSITIQPDGGQAKTITGSISGDLIRFWGADNITINGLNSGGNSLTIQNTSTSTSAGAITFNYDACDNVVTNCTLKASSGGSTTISSSLKGVVSFGNSTISSGNDNNNISYCDIGPAGSNLPWCLIYSYGSSTAGRENSSNTIDNCNLHDYFYDFSSGSSSSTYDAAVYLYYYGNTKWTISNNSIYQTATRNKSNNNSGNNTAPIFIRRGSDYNITGNYIGGSEPLCAGSAMTITGNTAMFHAIHLDQLDYAVASSITNNTVSNINFTSGCTTSSNGGIPRWTGLIISGGEVDVTGNTIGSQSSTDDIVLTHSNSTFTIYYGISPISSSTYYTLVNKCNNNSIGGMTLNSNYFDSYGMYFTGGASCKLDSISNNVIGSETISSSIKITPSNPSSTRNTFQAIFTSSISLGDHIISDNTIKNIYRGPASASSLFAGIRTFLDDCQVSSNIIENIKDESNNTNGNYGIYVDGDNAQVSNNFIKRMGSTYSSYEAVSGVYHVGSTGGTVFNNIVVLGKDDAGASYTSRSFGGITVRYATEIYLNTVYLEGDCNTSSRNSYAYYDYYNSSARIIKDNIFVNNRNNTSGTSSHYAAYIYGTSGLTMDYNDFYVTGSGGYIGYLSGSRSTLLAFQSATGQNANSINVDPDFANAGGTSANDYFTTAVLTGITLTGYTTDYLAITRNTPPMMGALEKSFVWKGTIDTDFATAGNWMPAQIPQSGSNIVYDDNPLSNCVLDGDRTIGSLRNLSAYYMDVNGHTLTINGSLNICTNAKVSAKSAGSTIVLQGTEAQCLPLNSILDNEIYNLNVDNSSGATICANTLISNTLTLTSGNLIIGDYDLTVNGLSGGNANAYIMTNGSGKLKYNISDAASFDFHVGNTSYNPVNITNNSGSADDFSVRILDEVYYDGLTGSAVTAPRVKRTWDISKTTANGGSGVDFVFYWNSGETFGLTSPILNHFEGGVWNMLDYQGTATATSMIHTGYTGTFSPFTIGKRFIPLPVELLSFDVTCDGNSPMFEWITLSEQNNDYFTIEESNDMKYWTKLTEIVGEGNSNTRTEYNWLYKDFNSEKGKYFRLIQTDFDGSSEIIGEVSFAGCSNELSLDVAVYPNPSKDKFQFIGTHSLDSYSVFSLDGKLILKGKFDVDNPAVIDLGEFNTGVYYVKLKSENIEIVKKIILSK